MKILNRTIRFFSLLGALVVFGGCSRHLETTAALDDSQIPWGRPVEWEKSMPVAPGFQY
jgi:hypothetical protein